MHQNEKQNNETSSKGQEEVMTPKNRRTKIEVTKVSVKQKRNNHQKQDMFRKYVIIYYMVSRMVYHHKWTVDFILNGF